MGQVVAGAAGSVRGAVPLPPPPPPPSVSAGAAASAAATGAASGAVSGAVRPDVSSRTDSTGVNANATSRASAEGRENGLAIATQVSGGAATTLDVDAIVRSIHETGVEARATVTAEMEKRLGASEKLMADLDARARKADKDTRAAFAKAQVEARAKAKMVRDDLKAATKSADVTAWGKVQSSLAEDYRAYGQAVAAAEASVNASK